jgi:hypothetical protein
LLYLSIPIGIDSVETNEALVVAWHGLVDIPGGSRSTHRLVF